MSTVNVIVDGKPFTCLSCKYENFEYNEETGDCKCCFCNRQHYGLTKRIGYQRGLLIKHIN